MNKVVQTNAPKVVVVNDTRPDRHYGCQAVMEAMIVMLARAGMRVTHFHPVGRAWQQDQIFIESSANAQLVVVNGEGTIHHANERAQRLAQLGPFCRHTLRVPSVLLNATLHANDAAIYNAISKFDVVQVRDKASVAEAVKFGLPEPRYCPDLSLFHDFTPSSLKDRAEVLQVGITDSIIPKISEELEKLRLERKFRYCDIHMQANSNIYAYADQLSALDLLITGRFHAVCYALNTRTPFIAVESNTPKISNLLMDVFGSTGRIVSPKDLATVDFDAFAQWSEREIAALNAFSTTRDNSFRSVEAAIRNAVQRTAA